MTITIAPRLLSNHTLQAVVQAQNWLAVPRPFRAPAAVARQALPDLTPDERAGCLALCALLTGVSRLASGGPDALRMLRKGLT